MARPVAGSPSARDRIVDVASALFYARGIHQVGINEVVEKSGVARMTLYHHFPSKDAIVAAVLDRRVRERAAELDQVIARAGDPRRRLLALFRYLEDLVSRPDYRGCAFINAAVDRADADDPSHAIVARAKRDLAARIETIARDAGLAHPARFAMQCLLLWDGAAVESYLQGGVAPVRAARQAAAALMDAASP